MQNNVSRILVAVLPLPFSLLAAVLVLGTLAGGAAFPHAPNPAPVPTKEPETVYVTDTLALLPTEVVVQSDQQTVQVLKDATATQAQHLDGMQHFLEDKILLQKGAAPRHWKQPPLEDYFAPGAPESFIPSK